MASRNPTVNRIRNLFLGHDNGRYTLPEELLDRRRALGRVTHTQTLVAVAYTAVDTVAIQSALVSDLPERAMAGDLPAEWAAEFHRATEERARLDREMLLLTQAIEVGEANLVRTARALSDDILAEHLRPLLVALIERVRKAGEVVPDTFFEQPGRLAKASAEVRKAYTVIEEAAGEYAALREAQRTLQMAVGSPEPDAYALFGEVRNLPALWPGYGWRSPSNNPPWPKDRLARLVWLARPDVETWMPTADECDGAWDDLRKFQNTLRKRDALPVA